MAAPFSLQAGLPLSVARPLPRQLGVGPSQVRLCAPRSKTEFKLSATASDKPELLAKPAFKKPEAPPAPEPAPSPDAERPARPARPERPASVERPARAERPERQERGDRPQFTITKKGDTPPPRPQREDGGGRGGRGMGRGGGGRGRGPPGADRGPPGGGGGAAPGADAGRGGRFRAARAPGGGLAGDGGDRGRDGGGRGRGRGGGRRRQEDNRIQSVEGRRKGRQDKRERLAEKREAEKSVREEILEVGQEGMSVRDLAAALAINEAAVIKALFLKGVATSVTQTLSRDLVVMVAEEHETEVLFTEELGVENMARKTEDFLDAEDIDFMLVRPPVVTVMGHVDHGKTSLLDAIRSTRVAKGEAGGITQAIGAYQVSVKFEEEDRLCTFLDTPGHEAFSAMRARGAKVTDIAVILVAADDGVKPQTVEAIKHAQAAEVPMVVAINKIDKEAANVDRTKQMLAEVGLLPEEWGGETPMIPVSAHVGTGIDELLETIMLQAEMQELMANPDRKAAGTVLEAYLDKARGPTASLLVQAGTLKQGDVVLSRAMYGKVRSIVNDKGETLEAAGPSTPVQILGLNAVPNAGDTFEVCESESEARSRAEEAAEEMRTQRLAEQAGGGSKVTLANLKQDWNSEDGDPAKLNIILKGDTSGSIEAIKGALNALPQEKVVLRFLMSNAGDITSSDIDLADASEGIVFGFNVPIPESVLSYASDRGVEVRSYNVIYDLIDEVTAAMEGLLTAVVVKEQIGEAEVRQVFGGGSTKIAGCYVQEGKLMKGCNIRVTRGSGKNEKELFDGELTSLRRIKDQVKEVERGVECGVIAAGFNEWKDGDKIVAFNLVTKAQTLDGVAEMAGDEEEEDN